MKTKKDLKVSVIIPAYNEQQTITECIESLKKQSYKNMEIIVVDDGSTDQTSTQARKLNTIYLKQDHKGAGSARNLGASKATGEILVFLDADMTFDSNFVRNLIRPVLEKKSIGTFSKDEFVSNYDNVWAKCWNLNRGINNNRMINKNYPDRAPVFRSILKKEFARVGGFEISGDYTDDWSLSEKLKVQSTLATSAIYYHKNPSSLKEVWSQASWIGKNRFITGNLFRFTKSLVYYSLPFSVVNAFTKSIFAKNISFFIFKIVYDFATFTSLISTIFTKKKFK